MPISNTHFFYNAIKQAAASISISLKTSLTICLWSFICVQALSPRNTQYTEEQREIESIRYRLNIENQIMPVENQLQKLIDSSQNKEIKSQAYYLLGRLHEKALSQGNHTLPSQKAILEPYEATLNLSAAGLMPSEKLLLYTKLFALNPQSLRPMDFGAKAISGLIKVFPQNTLHGMVYNLMFSGTSSNQVDHFQFGIQKEQGDFLMWPLQINSDQEVIDLTAEVCLLFSQNRKTIQIMDTKGNLQVNFPLEIGFENGKIISGNQGEILLWGNKKLCYFHAFKKAWETTLPFEHCQMPSQDAREALGKNIFIQCSDGIVQVDLNKKTMHALKGQTEKPLNVFYQDRNLGLQTLNTFAWLTAPNYDTPKWTIPAQIQDQFYLNRQHIYVLNSKGTITSLNSSNGEIEWQKDFAAAQIILYEAGILVLTFNHNCLSLNREGKVLWNYEYGADQDPKFLPSEDKIWVHYADGKRIVLKTDLLKITAYSPTLKFQTYIPLSQKEDQNNAQSELKKILALEPGNGLAWNYRFSNLKNFGGLRTEAYQCLLEATRSTYVPASSNHPLLKNMATFLDANWIWKRKTGPAGYPNIIPHKNMTFFIEQDNQSITLINNAHGELINTFHFPEEIDGRIAFWKGDTLCVSSNNHLYFLAPNMPLGSVGQITLKNPLCQAIVINSNIIASDWQGHLFSISLGQQKILWNQKLGHTGFQILKSKGLDNVDAIDFEGHFYALNAKTGNTLWSFNLPAGTVTEVFAGKENVYAGYTQGQIVALDKNTKALLWSRNFGDQIFSLSGNHENVVLITLGSKKMLTLNAQTGETLAQTNFPNELFLKPAIGEKSYWIGTNEPALEKRNFNHQVLAKFKLPEMPGTPIISGNTLYISTAQNFLLSFPINTENLP